MKKFLLLTFVALATIAGRAGTKTFTDSLVVSVNGNASPAQLTTIVVDNNTDGTYNLSLKNFILGSGADIVPVGNINLTNVAGAMDSNGKVKLTTNQTIQIAAGDEGYTMKVNGEDYTFQASDWMGPSLGDVPVNLTAYMKGDKIYCLIDIYMASLKQTINVRVGSEYVSTSYKDNLVVTINKNASAPQSSTVNLEQSLVDDSYNLSLKNFILGSGADIVPVGNINMKKVDVTTDANGLMHISTNQTIQIAAGDPGYTMKVNGEDYTFQTDDWMGPSLKDVPVVLTGIANATKMAIKIDIDMQASLKQIIGVTFGTMSLDAVADMDLGKVYVGQTLNKPFMVNGFFVGNVNVAVASDAASNVFAVKNQTVAAGDLADLICTPAGVGSLTATVTLSADGVTPVTFHVAATAVQAKIAASETALDFGDVDQGYGRTKTLNVTGTDLAEDIAVTVKGSTDFKVSTTTLKEGTTELSVLYAPSTKDANKATLVLSSKYAADVEIPLTGNMIVSGIAGVAADSALVNVYTVNGVLVRKDVKAQDALNGLTRGVYVVNGKKILK